MKFIKIHDKRTGIDYPWMADIQSIADFLEIEKGFCSRDAWCIMDFLQSKDYSDILNDTFSGAKRFWGDHCHPNNKLFDFLYASVLTFPQKEKFYPLLYFVEKLSQASKIKLEYLAKTGRILVNSNGGFMTWNSNHVETDSIVQDHFPQYDLKEVKVSKWPEGKHFYATINGTSIVADGVEKWNTEKDAYAAARKWLGVEKS